MNKLKIFTFVLVILIQRINAQQNCNLSNHDMNVSVEYIENLPLTLKQRISHKDIYGNHYFKEGKRKIYEVDQMMKFDKNTSLITPFVNGTEKEQAPYSNLTSLANFTAALPVLKQHVISRNQAVSAFVK